jgi:hypothetical protein
MYLRFRVMGELEVPLDLLLLPIEGVRRAEGHQRTNLTIVQSGSVGARC